MSSAPDEIRRQIDKLHSEIDETIKSLAASPYTVPVVLQKHAAILDLTSKLAEIASDKLERQTIVLIRLTWALVIVSIALVVFALVQTGIMLKQNTDAHPQQVQASQTNATGSNHQ